MLITIRTARDADLPGEGGRISPRGVVLIVGTELPSSVVDSPHAGSLAVRGGGAFSLRTTVKDSSSHGVQTTANVMVVVTSK